MKGSLRDYYKQYTNKLDNLEEMGKFLRNIQPTEWIIKKQKMWTDITSKEIELVIKNLSTSKSPGPDGCTIPNIQRINTNPSQTLPKNRRTTSKLILQGLHYPNSKTRQGQCKKRKSQANIPDEHSCKNPQQNSS